MKQDNLGIYLWARTSILCPVFLQIKTQISFRDLLAMPHAVQTLAKGTASYILMAVSGYRGTSEGCQRDVTA